MPCILLRCKWPFGPFAFNKLLMSVIQAINDKLQGSVATYLRCGAVVNNYIKKGLFLSLRVKLFCFKIGECLAKLEARTLNFSFKSVKI